MARVLAGDPEPTTLWDDTSRLTSRILGLAPKAVPSDIALAALIDRGEMSCESVAGLIRAGIPERDIFRIVIPRRTYQRRRQAGEALAPSEADGAVRVARILALASIVFAETPKAISWLTSPKRRFDGLRPLDLVSSSVGERIVEATLVQAYFGTVA